MPERWERSLQSLKEVGAPATVAPRVAEGPRGQGDPGPTPGRRAVTIALAFVVFVAGSALAWRAFEPNGRPSVGLSPGEAIPLSIELRETAPADGLTDTVPSATVSYDAPWAGSRLNAHVSLRARPDPSLGAIPGDFPTFALPVPVLATTPVAVSGGGDLVVVRATQLLGREVGPSVDLSPTSPSLDLAPGHWLVDFEAGWPNETAWFEFDLWVVDAGPGVAWAQLEPPTPNGPRGDLVTSSGAVTGRYLGGVWDSGDGRTIVNGQDETVPFADGDYMPIETGTVLAVSGATSVVGTLQEPGGMGDGLGLDLSDDAAPLTAPPGRYLLQLNGHWEGGTVAWLFPIQIVAPSQGSSETAPTEASTADRLDVQLSSPAAGDDWPTAHFALGGETVSFGPADMWGWGNDQAFSMDRPALTVRLAPGARIVVSGDPGQVLGSVRSTAAGSPPRSLTVGNRTRASDLLTGPARLPATPGDYELTLQGKWLPDIGVASWVIRITVAEPSADAMVSDILRVACGQGGAEIAEPTVVLQPDGAHVEVVDAGGFGDLLLEPVDPYQTSFASGSDGLDGPFVRELVPGRWRAACVDGTQDGTLVKGWARFTVVDPDSVWIPTTLACDQRNWVTSSPVGTVPKIDGETPEQAIVRALSLPSTDVVEPAGFPDSVTTTYRVIRDGATMAWLLFEDWRPGDWRSSPVFTCQGAGIGFANGQS